MSHILGFRTPKPYTDYDWMHPSWRDLVVEHLQASKADRERFLSRCGAEGILLALSSSGGGKGTRETPLLVDAGDWMRLQATTLPFLKSAEHSYEVRMVLGAIYDAMFGKFGTKQPRLVSPSDPLHSLAVKSLETLRTRWNAGNYAISAACLSEYNRVSVLVSPLPPMPNMQPTWEDLWASVIEVSSNASAERDAWTEAVSGWLDLVEIVVSSEPRLLKQMAFPGSYLDALRGYLDYIERDADSDLDFDSPSDYDTEISRLEEVEGVVEHVGSVISSLEDRAQVVEAAVALARSNLRDRRDENFPEPPDDYEGRAPSSRPSGGFDVDELFADL